MLASGDPLVAPDCTAPGKMISPQNIAIGVTTVGLIDQEGKILRATFLAQHPPCCNALPCSVCSSVLGAVDGPLTPGALS